MNTIYGNSINMLNKSLDYLWLRQGVTSNNIANNDTVGYKAQYVTFEEEFRKELDAALNMGGDSFKDAIDKSFAKVHTSQNEGLRLDGNNVNVEVEMIELTRTSFQYRYALDSISSDINRLSTAIKG